MSTARVPTGWASGERDRTYLLFLDGEALAGRWDAESGTYHEEDGARLDIQGHPISLGAREDEAEEEAGWEEERRMGEPSREHGGKPEMGGYPL